MIELFPSQVLTDTMYWGRFLGEEWVRDFPQHMYEGGLEGDGTPQRWAADFAKWIENAPDEDGRGRTTKVMRKLRRASPREYEVLYRAMVLGETVEDVTKWLNERAQRNAIPLPPGRNVHYRLKDCIALFIAGVDYARSYW